MNKIESTELTSTSNIIKDPNSLSKTTLYSQSKTQSAIKAKKQHMFNMNFKGSCNFLVFWKFCMPCIPIEVSNSVDSLSLSDFITSLEEVSAKGLQLSLSNHKEKAISVLTYSPTLSLLELRILNKLFLKQLNTKIKELELAIESPGGDDYKEYSIGELLKVIFYSDGGALVRFSEARQVHNRLCLAEQLSQISDLLSLGALTLEADIDIEFSFIAVTWNPIPYEDSELSRTSFISFYQFKFLEHESPNYLQLPEYLEMILIGILPINLDPSWTKRITSQGMYKTTPVEESLDLGVFALESVKAILEFLPEAVLECFDYRQYLKYSMYI